MQDRYATGSSTVSQTPARDTSRVHDAASYWSEAKEGPEGNRLRSLEAAGVGYPLQLYSRQQTNLRQLSEGLSFHSCTQTAIRCARYCSVTPTSSLLVGLARQSSKGSAALPLSTGPYYIDLAAYSASLVEHAPLDGPQRETRMKSGRRPSAKPFYGTQCVLPRTLWVSLSANPANSPVADHRCRGHIINDPHRCSAAS
jgi:hypothetical protein